MKLRLVTALLIVAALTSTTILSIQQENIELSNPSRVIFWYSNISGVKLAEAAPTLAVLDPDEITSDWVKRLSSTGTKVLAYINFGMAENWRSYWKPEWLRNPPQWLGPKHPKWRGEYLVRFWDQGWLKIVKEMTRDLLDRGFSGVMLDNIDVCIYWGRCDILPEIFREIRNETKFKLYVNLGQAWETVYLDDFVRNIDGVIVEEAITKGEKEIIQALGYVAERGKDVVLIEYANNRAKVEELLRTGEELGFKIFVGNKALSKIPEYMPLYHGIQYLDGKILYAYKPSWQPFKIYLNSSELDYGERASGTIRDGKIAVAYESGDKHVRVLLDDEVVYESKGGCREPTITLTEDGFAVAYICEEKSRETIYLAELDVSGKVIQVDKLLSDNHPKRHPIIASNGDKLALVFERDGVLLYTDLREFITIGSVEPYSYTVTSYGNGFAVIYTGADGGAVIFPNVTIRGVPEILWESNAIEYNGRIYYISRRGWIMAVCPNGSWVIVKQLDKIYSAGMWLTIIDGKVKVFGLDDVIEANVS